MTTMRLLEHIPVPPAFVHAWDRMSSRERRLAVAAVAVVLLAAVWGWFWQPMQEDSLRVRKPRKPPDCNAGRKSTWAVIRAWRSSESWASER